MNVLMAPSWYKNEKNSILGSFFREQALALTRLGHRVYVADATFQGADALRSKRLFRLKKLEDEGLITYSFVLPALGISRTPSGGVGIYRRSLHRIYKALRKDGVQIDLIQAHSFYPAGYGAVWLGKRYGIPVVVTEHNSLVLTKKLPPRRVEMLKETVERADGFVCVSHALKDAVVSLTGTRKPVRVLPNSVSDSFFYAPKERTGTFTFVSVGNLIPGKRFDLTLTAFARLHERHQDLRLKIAGDGHLRDTLVQQAEALSVGDAVEFLGRVPRQAVPKLLQDSDAFVLPSDAETFGVVYIEALACGKPVIGTRNGGAEEIITHENGVLVDKNDAAQLYEAMRCVYEDISRYDGAVIAADHRVRYGEEALARRTVQLYQEIISLK